MKKMSAFLSYVLQDLLGDLEGISHRAMFGGVSLYQHGIIFGIVIEDTLYFKVNQNNRPQYEALGSTPFTYVSPKNKIVTMPYWTVPEEILEDPDTLKEWVTASIAVAGS